MFLRPQHLQAAERYRQHFAAASDRWNCHYSWGLRKIVLDLDALANHHFVVRELRARFRDGTLVSIPEESDAFDVHVEAAVKSARGPLTIYLALPARREGRANVAADRSDKTARFLLTTQKLNDENDGQNEQEIQLRLLNLQLLTDLDDREGYEVLPIARIKRSPRPDAPPELDESYIPPLLACDGWTVLHHKILQTIHSLIGQHIELQAGAISRKRIGFEAQHQTERESFEKLRMLNEAYAVLGVQAYAEGVHPFPAYLELCRIAGQLSIFGAARRFEDLPRYDHDNLGHVFRTVKERIELLIGGRPVQRYVERQFVGQGLRMQVTLEPDWLTPNQQMFIGVKSGISQEECENLLSRRQLNMKIGSSDRVENIFTLAFPGLEFTPCRRQNLPAALQDRSELAFFQINRDSQPSEWDCVRRELTLAIRLNERLIVGDIEGKHIVTIRKENSTITMEFTLFIVPAERGS